MTGEPLDRAAAVPSLRRTAAAGVKWTSAAAAAGVITTIVQPLILVRLLAPEDFGLMATVLVIAGFTRGFTDLGISAAIQVRQTVSREVLSSLYWANTLAGAGLAALIYLSAPLVADFYGEPELETLMHWAALAFLIAPIGTVHRARLERDLRFKAVAVSEVAAAPCSVAVAVAAAALGAGALAPLWGWLVGLAVPTVLVALQSGRDWRPGLRFRRADLRGYMSFGAYQMGQRSLNYIFSNVDYIIIGRFLGAEALGIYAVAYQLAVRPQVQFSPVVARVATPVLARKGHDDAALRRAFVELIRLPAFVMAPLLVGLAVVAPTFVPVVLGERWEDSIALLQILVGVGLMKSLSHPIGSVFLAKDRPDIGFKLGIGVLPAMAACFLVVVDSGTVAVAWVYLAFAVGTTLALTPLIMRRLIGLRFNDYLRPLMVPAVLVAAMAAVTVAVAVAAESMGAGGATTLTVSVAAGAVAYCGLLLRTEGTYVRELLDLLRLRRPKAPPQLPTLQPLASQGE